MKCDVHLTLRLPGKLLRKRPTPDTGQRIVQVENRPQLLHEDGAHGCAVSQNSRHQKRILNHLQSGTNRPPGCKSRTVLNSCMKTVHMECAVHPNSPFSVLRSSFFVLRSSFFVPSPGRSVTRARRLYVSRKANFRVSDPRYGAAHKDVRCRHCAKDGAFGGHPVPPLGAYTVSLLCVVGTERCVTQVPPKSLRY